MKNYKRVVLCEYAGHKEFIYQYKCGTLSYSDHRKRHNWIVAYKSGVRFACKEDYKLACDLAYDANKDGKVNATILLELDGKLIGHSEAQHFRRLSREWFGNAKAI